MLKTFALKCIQNILIIFFNSKIVNRKIASSFVFGAIKIKNDIKN